MGTITLDVGLYGATVVLFHIISVVHLPLGGQDRSVPTYTLQGSLPAAELDRALVEQLEDRILSVARSLVGPSDSEDFHVEIVDPLGTQRLKSIREYAGAQFFDGTTSIRLSYWKTSLLRIDLRFSTARDSSEITIELSGDSPREKAIGLQAELRALVATHATNNWIFRPTTLAASLLYVVTYLTLVAAFFAASQKPRAIAWTLVGTAALLLCYWPLRGLLPYTTFDSRQARARREVAKWLLLGVLGFFLFTVAGVFLRQQLFGY
jgi:hypothetical protein